MPLISASAAKYLASISGWKSYTRVSGERSAHLITNSQQLPTPGEWEKWTNVCSFHLQGQVTEAISMMSRPCPHSVNHGSGGWEDYGQVNQMLDLYCPRSNDETWIFSTLDLFLKMIGYCIIAYNSNNLLYRIAIFVNFFFLKLQKIENASIN